MRVLALDIGEKRVGCAYADTSHAVAVPLAVLPAAEFASYGRSVRRLIEDYEPELLLAGLPVSLSGERGPQAVRIEESARAFAHKAGIALEFCDERLTSAQAKRSLHDMGMTEKQMRGKLDSIAATIMLQSWLEPRCQQPLEEA